MVALIPTYCVHYRGHFALISCKSANELRERIIAPEQVERITLLFGKTEYETDLWERLFGVPNKVSE